MAKKRALSRTASTVAGVVYGAAAKRSPDVGSSRRMVVLMLLYSLEAEEDVVVGTDDEVSRTRRRVVIAVGVGFEGVGARRGDQPVVV